MKKLNLFLSVLVFALVLLLAGGATMAPAMQLQAMSLNTASRLTGTALFDSQGRYAVDSNSLNEGALYQFFGYDWRLVKNNGTVATFWMKEPYAATQFNETTRSNSRILPQGENIWANGYSNTTWNNGVDVINLGQSKIRQYLNDAAKTIIDNEQYANYKKNVYAGPVIGNNGEMTNKTVEHLAYCKDEPGQVESQNAVTNELTAVYGLDSSDRLWLPSIGDLRVWGIVNESCVVLNPNTLKWNETTIGGTYAWLREADSRYSEYALVVSYEPKQLSGETAPSYFHSDWVNRENGVRPAIHLNISHIDVEYQDHLDNPDGKGNGWFGIDWLGDDWLKALFMTVCIFGVIGVGLVLVAVIARARRNSQK